LNGVQATTLCLFYFFIVPRTRTETGDESQPIFARTDGDIGQVAI